MSNKSASKTAKTGNKRPVRRRPLLKSYRSGVDRARQFYDHPILAEPRSKSRRLITYLNPVRRARSTLRSRHR